MFRGIGPVELIAGPGDSGDELQPMMRWGPHALSLAGPGTGESAIVPVMARLGPADLETVDTLITAGIAANRADAVRWALARIRERPAYAKLRERAREIEEQSPVLTAPGLAQWREALPAWTDWDRSGDQVWPAGKWRRSWCPRYRTNRPIRELGGHIALMTLCIPPITLSGTMG